MSASHDYAKRIRARLPRTLQEEHGAAGMSRDALETKCDVSRERIGCIESVPQSAIAIGRRLRLPVRPA